MRLILCFISFLLFSLVGASQVSAQTPPILIGQCHSSEYLNDAKVSWSYPAIGPASWSTIQPTSPHDFNWEALDAEVQKAQDLGKKIMVQVLTSDPGNPVIPQWAADVGVRQLPDCPTSIPNCTNYNRSKPVQWDEKYLKYLENVISRLAEQYDGHPAVEAVLMMAGGNYGEMAQTVGACHGNPNADVHNINGIYIKEMARATGQTPQILTQPYQENCAADETCNWTGRPYARWCPNGKRCYVAKFDYYYVQNSKRLIDLYMKYFCQTPVVLQLGAGVSCQGYVADYVADWAVQKYGKNLWLKQNGWGNSLDCTDHYTGLFNRQRNNTRIIREVGHFKRWCYGLAYCERLSREEAITHNTSCVNYATRQYSIHEGVSAVCFQWEFFRDPTHFPVNFTQLKNGLEYNYRLYAQIPTPSSRSCAFLPPLPPWPEPETTPTATPILTCPGLNGDANQDSIVNDSDFEAWKEHFQGFPPTVGSGDLDCNSQLNLVDFEIWRENYRE